MIQITFLGTGSMIPTPTRNHPATLISYKSENILIDCGEGTQLQLRKAKIAPPKITKLLISHWHGDHILGIPGFIQTLGASNYQKTLEIYGPKGTKKYLKQLMSSFICTEKINYTITEISKGKFAETEDFILEAYPLDHSAPTLGFIFKEKDTRKINLTYLKKFNLSQHPILKDLQQGKDIKFKNKLIKASQATTIKPGKKIAIITDTKQCPNINKIAKDADLLISEATHLDELKEKADRYKHLTVKQTATIAKKAKAKQLAINHISQRYKTDKEIEKEAKSVFKNTIITKDLQNLTL